jgi:hypothetical protein
MKNRHFPSSRHQFQPPQACVARDGSENKRLWIRRSRATAMGHNAELPVHTLAHCLIWTWRIAETGPCFAEHTAM